MNGAALIAAVAAAGAVLLARPSAGRLVAPANPGEGVAPGPAAGDGLLRAGRPWWSLLAAVGAVTVVGGLVGVVLGAVAAVVVWVVATRAEPPAVRRRRVEVARGLPHVVGLLSAALASGASPAAAVRVVCRALPGAASDRLAPVADRLDWGGDPEQVWAEVAADDALGPLGRALGRAHSSGAPVGPAVERLGAELAATARAEVEDRARAVGVKAAVPLGVCLLPAFLLVGIVPLVAGLFSSFDW